MSVKPVTSEIRDGAAWITLNRPERMNALDEPIRRGLLKALRSAIADSAVSAIALTGVGRGFCVGQDLSAVAELDDAHDTVARTYNPLIETIIQSPKPVIAAINGAAVGAGMGVALACDTIVMAQSAFYSCAFGAVGLVPDSGTSFFLARRLGHQLAFEIAVSGRRILADEALALGLANMVVPDQELTDQTSSQLELLRSQSPKALALTKKLLLSAQSQPLFSTLEAEAVSQGIAASTNEHVNRRTSFLGRAAKKPARAR